MVCLYISAHVETTQVPYVGRHGRLHLRRRCTSTSTFLSPPHQFPLQKCPLTYFTQPDQARIVGINAHLFLREGGGVLVSVKANCIDSTKPAEQVFAMEVNKLRQERIKPREQLTLEPFERDHCMVAGTYLHSAQ